MASEGTTTAASEAENAMDKQTLLAVLQFLKKNNLKETEELLRKEAHVSQDVDLTEGSSSESDVNKALEAYRSEGDPMLYEENYKMLKDFIETSLDVHKCELAMILYPIFVHMYLELVFNDHEASALNFFEKFSWDQESYYAVDVKTLSTVTKPEHMRGNQLLENFKTSKFTIRMSRDSYNHLKRHLQDKKQNTLLTLIQEHLFIDVFDGVPRNKQQIEAAAGAMGGEAKREANKVKVYYGLLKEPEINIPIEEEEEPPPEESGTEKPKKKKAKKDPLLMKKSKNDPNAPPMARIPLPELKDGDKLEKIKIYKEASKRIALGSDQLPSVCFYTLLNANQGVSSMDICDDSSLLSVGNSDSTIKVWTLTPNKLRTMKDANDLDSIDREADDVLERMMDDSTASENKTLLGHTGPVYSSSFTPDRSQLVSASEDGTIRLWSLLTWTNLVSYKGHLYPTWDVKFGPYGHYFASGGYDRTARMWSTEHHQPIRIFAGHLADVDTVQFHPNGNYLASGSADRTVRLWDVYNGNCVRVMTGHKGTVHCMAFSPDGRFLASAGADRMVCLWDIATGEQIGQLTGHGDTIYSLAYSRDGTVLASGGLDNTVKLWDVGKVFEEQDLEGLTTIKLEESDYLLGTYPTKASPVLTLHFTRRNLLLAGGPFLP